MRQHNTMKIRLKELRIFTHGHARVHVTRSLSRLVAIVAPLLLSACTFTVNSTSDRIDANLGDGICADAVGQCTLRAAIMEVNEASARYRVAVPAGTYALTLAGANGGSLDITRDIRLQGAGKNQTIIDATNDSRVIHISGGSDVEIQSLTLTGGNAQSGGGMRVEDAVVTLTDVKFEDNFGFSGGGGLVVIDGAEVTGNYVEFIGNEATGAFGGAIWNLGRLVLNDSLMHDNTSNRAGALHNNTTGSLNLYNVTVSGNLGRSDSRSVGGIMQNGFAVLRNSTVTDNEGGAAPGAGGIQTTEGSITVAKNSIFADNFKRMRNSLDASDCRGPLSADSRYNLVQALDDCTLPAVTSSYILGVDARLTSLADNGGPTRTHRLLNDSPAIDAGFPYPPGSPAADACRARDQRGVPRPQTLFSETQSGICDLGAYEAGNLNTFINRFVLVNTDTDTDIAPLRHGDVLIRSELPENMSIRAEASNNYTAESVTFGYDNNPSVRTENSAPYSIAGDTSGDYSPFDFGITGNHTLRATPFGGDNGTGSAGGSWNITFTVVNN